MMSLSLVFISGICVRLYFKSKFQVSLQTPLEVIVWIYDLGRNFNTDNKNRARVEDGGIY